MGSTETIGAQEKQSATVLPAFYCPIGPAMHPDAHDINAQSTAWMYRFGLGADDASRRRMIHTRSGYWAARMCPTARPEPLRVLSDYSLWTFAFDDEYCDEGELRDKPGELARAVVRIHRSAEVGEELYPSDKYGAALWDVRTRMEALVGVHQTARFTNALTRYFLVETQGAGFNARADHPRLDEYMLYRLSTGGGHLLPELMTIIAERTLPPDLLEHRPVRAITEMSAALATLATDVASYRKERARTDGPPNIVDAIRAEYDCSEEQALELAMRIWDRIMTLFLRLRDHLVSATPALADYLHVIAQYVRGVVDMSVATARYRYADGEGGDEIMQTSGSGLHPHPRDDSTAPLSIPCIAWWWQYDPASTAK
ncbi:terpene synthase family protein [Streptomyces sp. BK340]|uniref:terpene synthase family protein n=1 Tax=Streptomyces sp. BK340 TaxID=2572903 RepID=UPI0011A5F25C|nr:terpene synthase family protein [Streptomyces sp. BK340]TVZ76729.1 terpene synthase family protein [Streptomyces sp. BK340]